MEKHRHAADHLDYRGGNGIKNKSVHPEPHPRRASGYSQRDAHEGDGRSPRGPKRSPERHRNRAGWSIVLDVLMAAMIMLVFYITNYVVQRELTGDMLPSQRLMAQQAARRRRPKSLSNPLYLLRQQHCALNLQTSSPTTMWIRQTPHIRVPI